MEPVKKKILWIDDDIRRFALKPYLDEFAERGFEIDKAENPDRAAKMLGLDKNFKGIVDEANMPVIVILDVSMPTGRKIDFGGETKGGMQTGFVMLKKLLVDPAFDNVKKVIFTIVDNKELRDYCDANDIPYLEKQDFLSDTFVDEIDKMISPSE